MLLLAASPESHSEPALCLDLARVPQMLLKCCLKAKDMHRGRGEHYLFQDKMKTGGPRCATSPGGSQCILQWIHKLFLASRGPLGPTSCRAISQTWPCLADAARALLDRSSLARPKMVCGKQMSGKRRVSYCLGYCLADLTSIMLAAEAQVWVLSRAASLSLC